jgi:hypothetical protein
MNKHTHLNIQYRRYLVNIKSRIFSSTRSTDGTYYDSQSARWITPHDPTYFRLTVDANNNPALKSIQLQNDAHSQFNFLSKRYSQFLLPIASDVFDGKKNNILDQNNLDSAVNDSLAILSTSDLKDPIKIPSYIMMNINVKTNDSSTIDETKKLVEANFEIGNRIRCTMTKFDSMAPWEVGCIAAEMCDVGCEEIFLDNVSQDDYGMDIDELIQVMEEICYIVSISVSIGSTLYIYIY